MIARRAAVTALPVVSYEHQRALAVGLLTCERVLAELDGRPPTSLSDVGRGALGVGALGGALGAPVLR